MTFEDWLSFGIEQGWCGPAVCHTHDGLPMSFDEEENFDLDEPCLHVVRLYESPEHGLEIEANHSPSVWRKHG
jgi:hypothetical protein